METLDTFPRDVGLFVNTGIHHVDFLLPVSALQVAGYKNLDEYEVDRYASQSAMLHLATRRVPGGVEGRLTVDTRAQTTPVSFRIKFAFPKKGKGEGPGIHLFNLRLQKDAPVRVGLAMDLGNTRSFVLAIDDLYGETGNHNALPIARLVLTPYEWRSGDRRVDAGVFDSYTVLQSPQILSSNGHEPPEPGRPGHFDCLSFTRLGSEAEWLQRMMIGDRSVPGRFSLSSPKRYFWQDDPELAGWKCYRSAGSPLAEPLSGVLAETLASVADGPAASLPRASVLSAMIVEVVEQAERYLNSHEHLEQSGLHRPRVISDVTVLCPAAWSEAQVTRYRDMLARGLSMFSSIRQVPEPRLDVSCDESTAVLITYAYSEMRKWGAQGENWVASVGRHDPLLGGGTVPAAVRIAVIDIGGGTSDLVIADVSDTQSGPGIRLSVRRVYQDGANRAGDEFLRALVQGIGLDVLSRYMFESEAAAVYRSQIMEWLLESPAERSMAETRVSWTRSLWFPLALALLDAVNRGEPEVRIQGHLQAVLGQFLDMARTWVDRHEDAKPFFMGKTPDHLRLGHEGLSDEVERIAGETFSEVAFSFTAAISAFDCDLVLFAGKSSEIPQVRHIFAESLPIPENRMVSLQGYHAGEWCPMAVGGRVDDAKVSTVLGAALYTISQRNPPLLGANYAIDVGCAPGLDEANHFWCPVNATTPRFLNESAIFDRNRSEATIPFSPSILLGRRRFAVEARDAELVYEIRLRPSVQERFGSLAPNARITLRKHTLPNRSVRVVVDNVMGGFANGTPLALDHIEIRHRILVHGDFWLDSGRLHSS